MPLPDDPFAIAWAFLLCGWEHYGTPRHNIDYAGAVCRSCDVRWADRKLSCWVCGKPRTLVVPSAATVY